jgi:hypothetical protein
LIMGSFRNVDLSAEPYNLGKPLQRIEESHKSDRRIVGLWDLRAMKLYVDERGMPLGCHGGFLVIY